MSSSCSANGLHTPLDPQRIEIVRHYDQILTREQAFHARFPSSESVSLALEAGENSDRVKILSIGLAAIKQNRSGFSKIPKCHSPIIRPNAISGCESY